MSCSMGFWLMTIALKQDLYDWDGKLTVRYERFIFLLHGEMRVRCAIRMEYVLI